MRLRLDFVLSRDAITRKTRSLMERSYAVAAGGSKYTGQGSTHAANSNPRSPDAETAFRNGSRILPTTHDDKAGGSSMPAHQPYVQSTYQRRPEHQPRVPQSVNNQDLYVLSLLTDKEHHRSVTELRNKYFPTSLNKLGAHITLFHALPGSRYSEIVSTLEEAVKEYDEGWEIHTTKPFALGSRSNPKGVGINVSPLCSERTTELCTSLQTHWREILSEQDRGKFRAKYTIMNKADDATKVWDCIEEVENGWCLTGVGKDGWVEGVRLWRYERGYWKDGKDFRFGRAATESKLSSENSTIESKQPRSTNASNVDR